MLKRAWLALARQFHQLADRLERQGISLPARDCAKNDIDPDRELAEPNRALPQLLRFR
jgi:hypothetical protein